MFETPVDTWYVWIGLAIASVVLAGVVGSLPRSPPPDAGAAADTLDGVAAGEYAATAEHQVDATHARLGPHRIGLRNDAGSSHGTITFGPVTPTTGRPALEAVVRGERPERAFDSKRAFENAVTDAHTGDRNWQPVEDRLTIRAVVWGEQRVTLVAA